MSERYGRRLAVNTLPESGAFTVVEVDEYGLIKGQWGESSTAEDAVKAASAVLDDLYGDTDMRADVDAVHLVTARLLPSDALLTVLKERGDLP